MSLRTDRKWVEGLLGRREWLRRTLAAPVAVSAVGLSGRGLAAEEEDGPSGMILRQKGPENLEYPFSTLDPFLTPNESFYVRTHFEVPDLKPGDWRLKVEGAVENAVTLDLEEIKRLPSKTMTAMLECAGNGRMYLPAPQPGIRWDMGGVSNAEWTGVPLSAVLERAGVKSSAVEVVLEGADRGQNSSTPGEIAFARSLPIEKARQPEVLLAYKMNGEDLPKRHGFPLRAVVTDWYGMASVKWLTRIVVTDRPFDGFFQTFNYTIWQRRDGLPSLVPVTEMQVKSQIARPAPYEVVPRGKPYLMRGAAWAGGSSIARVEISDDGGKTWSQAKLTGKSVPHAWRFWEWEWSAPDRSGPLVLMSRATDSEGRTQPMTRDPDRRDSMINHVLPIEVVLR